MILDNKIVIELNEYGIDGEITLEPLNFRRRRQFENNIGKAVHYRNGRMDVVESQDLGDLTVYKVMAYITSAPFGYGRIDGFYSFMDRVDQKSGKAEELFQRLQDEVKKLEEMGSPLDNSQEISEEDTEHRGCRKRL